jgi:hypothetical protein
MMFLSLNNLFRFARHSAAALASLFTLALALGCSTPGAHSEVASQQRGSLVELNVIAIPVGLNLDRIPGPESFSVKIFGNDSVHPKAVPIRSGTLEILAFDGGFFGRSNLPPVLKVWRYAAGDLLAHRFNSSIGTGYEFTLSWGTNHPTRTLMSVAARYTSDQGEVLTSRASSVSVLNP